MTLRKANATDEEMLLEWRNDPETRKNSHNTDVVSPERHSTWLQAVLADKHRELYIWLEDDVPAGTVRADWDADSESYELSWTISGDFRGKGIGKRMVKSLAEQLNTRLRAEFRPDNHASMKIAKFAGLTFSHETDGVVHYANYPMQE